MKIVLINCYPNLEHSRTEPIRKYLNENGYDVTMITSNYDHFMKQELLIKEDKVLQINVPKYKKNISINRLYSHYVFVNKTIKELEKIKPDIIYAKIPPNYLVYSLYKFKKRNNIKLIYDVYDLWPESFPIKCSLIKPFFYLWKKMRNDYLELSDYIIYECNLYKQIIHIENSETLYLSQKDFTNFKLKDIKCRPLKLCYLGNISHLVDIDQIIKFLKILSEKIPISLEIIGDGENKNTFYNRLKEINCKVNFHGIPFDENEKLKIMENCHFGLNIMIETSLVGLSNKSVEYFKCGLGVINNIKYDTEHLVNDYSAGFNITYENVEVVAEEISRMSTTDLMTMKKNSRRVFLDNFDESVAIKKIEKIFKKVLYI